MHLHAPITSLYVAADGGRTDRPSRLPPAPKKRPPPFPLYYIFHGSVFIKIKSHWRLLPIVYVTPCGHRDGGGAGSNVKQAARCSARLIYSCLDIPRASAQHRPADNTENRQFRYTYPSRGFVVVVVVVAVDVWGFSDILLDMDTHTHTAPHPPPPV